MRKCCWSVLSLYVQVVIVMFREVIPFLEKLSSGEI